MLIISEGTLDLLKLLPEGTSVVAVIAIVILFLKQQRETSKQVKDIADGFNARIKEVADGFQLQITTLTNQIFENQKIQQQQMQRLFDGFMEVSRETVKAVVELRGAVDNLSKKAKEKQI